MQSLAVSSHVPLASRPGFTLRNRQIIARQFALLVRLASNPKGLSSRQLATAVRASLPTVNRDLIVLRKVEGIRLERVVVNGETRHQLKQSPLATLSPTPLQLYALKLARQLLRPLAGTAVLKQYDQLLSALPVDAADVRLSMPSTPPPSHEAQADTIETAMRERRKLRFSYKAANNGGRAETHHVDPLTLRFADDDVYLIGFSDERGAERTFKLARVERLKVLDVAAKAHNEIPLQDLFRRSLKAWSGDLQNVEIALSAAVEWLLDEYPLHKDQQVARASDGRVIVRAQVQGILETRRWVLLWGKHAEVIGPEPLRALIAEEVRALAEVYGTQAGGEGRSSKVSEVGARGAGESRAKRERTSK